MDDDDFDTVFAAASRNARALVETWQDVPPSLAVMTLCLAVQYYCLRDEALREPAIRSLANQNETRPH